MSAIAKRARKVSLAKTRPGQLLDSSPTQKEAGNTWEPCKPLAFDDVIATPYRTYTIGQETFGTWPVVKYVHPKKIHRSVMAALGARPRHTHHNAYQLDQVMSREACDRTLSEAVGVLQGIDFDTIAVRGVSGLLIGPPLAFIMKKELLVVRKGEKSASSYDYEGHIALRRFIIADDLMSSGSTVVQICRKIKNVATEAELVGVLLYSGSVEFYDTESSRVRRALENAASSDFVPIR